MAEDTDALRREVEQARSRLGETVDALTHKAAAPRRAARRLRPPVLGLAVLVVVVGIAALRMARR